MHSWQAGTGEVGSTSDNERMRLFDAVIEHTAGRVPVVANVGGLTAAQGIRLARSAEASGADVLMLIAPHYEPLTTGEITRHFEDVGSCEAPDHARQQPGRDRGELPDRVTSGTRNQ